MATSKIKTQALNDEIRKGWFFLSLAGTKSTSGIFTCSGDQTAYLVAGMKIKWTDGGGTRYGYVYSSSYSGGTGLTTVNLVTHSDTTNQINASSISDIYVSPQSAPVGHPIWLSYTPTASASSGTVNTLTVNYCKLRCEGSSLTLQYNIDWVFAATGGNGASISIPVTTSAGATDIGTAVRFNDGLIRGAMVYLDKSNNRLFHERYDGGGYAGTTVTVRGQITWPI